MRIEEQAEGAEKNKKLNAEAKRVHKEVKG